jgi:predicted DNA-binding antitoxin AbrB/MazE fold protein
MTISIKGTFQNGVAQPIEPVVGHEGQQVIITFVEESTPVEKVPDDSGWDRLMQIIEENTFDAGIEDLSYQHDHYLYGKPKQD